MNLESVNRAYNDFLTPFKSVILSTVDGEGVPNASYAPFVIDTHKHIFVYISSISKHYGNIKGSGQVSTLFIKDEQESEQIFARHRLTYDCKAEMVDRDSDTHTKAMGLFDKKFGEDVAVLKNFDDFDLFRLIPQKGLLVLGFGQAYAISGDALDEVKHLQGAGGKGHTIKKR